MLPLPAFRSILLMLGGLFPCTAAAQAIAGVDEPRVQRTSPPAADAGTNPGLSPTPVAVAAGTRALMVLRSPLHSTSGVEGAGVYLEILQPVAQENRIVIPAHTQVQGVVVGNKRPGHFRRTAEFTFRFTTMIFPNNRVVAINGALLSIPGSRYVRTQGEDRRLRTVHQTERAVASAIVGATGGTLFGSVARLGIGKFAGGGLGAGLGLEGVLLARGDDISLASGTAVEMVLQSPFVLEAEQAAFNAQYVPPPAAAQPQNAVLNKDQTEFQKRDRPRRPPHTRFGGLLLPLTMRR